MSAPTTARELNELRSANKRLVARLDAILAQGNALCGAVDRYMQQRAPLHEFAECQWADYNNVVAALRAWRAAHTAASPPPAVCADCGVPYDQHGCDLVLADQDWRRIAPDNPLLCGTCICRRVAKYGGVSLMAWMRTGPGSVPPGYYAKLEDECRAIDQIFNPKTP